MTDKDLKAETKRDRVRRIVFNPLDEEGIRPNPKVTEIRGEDGKVTETREERHRRFLDALADSIAHMGDESLAALREAIKFNTLGDGKPTGKRRGWRGCWPSRIDVLDWANAIEKFPMDKVPGLKGWFASVEGPRALENDIAVETFEWIRDHKRPPYRDRDIKTIQHRAAERRREVTRCRERLQRGPDASAENQLSRYNYRLDTVRKLIREFRGDKGLLA